MARITPLGDSALLVQLCDELADDPAVTLREVMTACRRLEEAELNGVTEIVPAYTSIAVHYDPLRLFRKGEGEVLPAEWLQQRISRVLASGTPLTPIKARRVDIPVRYGDEWGPDLEAVARQARLDPGEVIRRHAGAEYLVHCLGFTPGFAYLSGLPPELVTPRLATPRKEVPAGSVAIGGAQTGVYPMASPGGWHLIGRTALTLFAPKAEPPTLLRVGDRVRFVPMGDPEGNAAR